MSEVAKNPTREPRGSFMRKGAWTLADQALLSGTNFITMVLVARGVSADAFGMFTLVYTGLLFANSMQSALITQPHNVLGAARKGEDYLRYTASTAYSQLAVAFAAALLALIAASVAFAMGWTVAPLLLALSPSIAAWQLQEFVRRTLYTERRPRAAFVNDLISYGGQAVIVAVLWWLQELTATRALYAIAGASTLAAARGMWQLRASLTRQFDKNALKENWDFGKWLAGGELLRWLSSAQMYQYLAAIILGTAATATLKSAQVIFGPARMLSLSLNTVLPTRFSRTYSEKGDEALTAELKHTMLLIAPLLTCYCLLVAVFARPLLRLVYGEKYVDGADVLALYALSSLLGFLMQIISAALKAKRLTRYIFNNYIYTSIIAIGMGWIFIKVFGVKGALVGMITTSVVTNVLYWLAYYRSRSKAPIETAQLAPAAQAA